MPSLYQTSIPPLTLGLQNLLTIIQKAETHATSQNFPVDSFIPSRIHATMKPFPYQIQCASNITSIFLSLAAPHLTLPTYTDSETTFASLHTRLSQTISFLQTVQESDFLGSEEDSETISPAGPKYEWVWKNKTEFLLYNVLPNFWFHVTTAYDILRMEGVPVGKLDYLNGAGGLELRSRV